MRSYRYSGVYSRKSKARDFEQQGEGDDAKESEEWGYHREREDEDDEEGW
jgi:hypothetical protein